MKPSSKDIQKLIAYAKTFVGTPYERGAQSEKTKSFDCSSFIQHLFHRVGIDLPRSSILQAGHPEGVLIIPKQKHATYKSGDVLFMSSDRGFYFNELFANRHLCIGHVALYIGNGKVIHARQSKGGVVIESLQEVQKNKAYAIVAIRRYTQERPIYNVPTRSQYLHIHHHEWKDRACGIVSVGMVLLFYKKKIKNFNHLLHEGLKLKGYKDGVGWTHEGLVRLIKTYKLHAEAYDWNKDPAHEAFLKLVSFLEYGPIIASIHKDFDPKNDGHLIVVTGYKDGYIYYNEPASRKNESIKRKLTKEKFLNGWKRRMLAIYIHP